MTGFGRSEIINSDRKIIVEIKAVNHRYCDLNIKMPKKLSFLEASMRDYLKKYIQRGKVDIFITYEDYTESGISVKYNADIAKEYVKYLQQMSNEFGIPNTVNTTVLSKFPDVFSLEEQPVDEEALWKILKEALDAAATQFVETRIQEGENLKKDLISKLEGMQEKVNYIENNSPPLVMQYREKLERKVHELLESTVIDEARIATEVTIYADKICVDEETVRLKSHIESTKQTLIEGGSVGRKLDFIAQEMNREANTILSKANSLVISDCAIELKTEIEKVREQIQNIE